MNPLWPGHPYPLGATFDGSGVNFALFSQHANSVTLLVFEAHDSVEPVQEVALSRTFHFWHAHLEGLGAGAHYAFRVDGPWDPAQGHRFNRNRVLVDPYSKGNSDTLWNRGDAGDTVSGTDIRSVDNLAHALRSAVIDPRGFDWGGDAPLRRPMQDSVLYEMHIGGFTKHPNSGVKNPGTFLGAIEKIPYLKDLGITAVELLPVHAHLDDRHLVDRKLPDKAIDLIDEAGAILKLRAGGGLAPMPAGEKAAAKAAPERLTVRARDIEAVLSTMARIPAQRVGTDDRERLRNLESEIKAKVFGQDNAVERVCQAIRTNRAGLGTPERPIGCFLFAGPTGVGKTELARQLAEVLGVAFLRYDMSEYMERHTVSRLIGAPPGYVGFDQGGLLTDAVHKTPHAVLLLDEIEKAHPDLFNILLQVMDHGALTDNNGRTSDFRHIILIMTSNVGARDLSRRMPGFGAGDRFGDTDEAFKRVFSPEFRNRLDAKVDFAPLGEREMLLIVDKFVGELQKQLGERRVIITLSPAAREMLAKKGYDPMNGARPLARVMQDEVKRPLTDELLFGTLASGGSVTIDVADNKLTFAFAKAAVADKPPDGAGQEDADDE